MGFPDLKTIIILLLLGFALSLFLLWPSSQEKKQDSGLPAPVVPECSNGDVKSCVSHNCTGTIACKSGKWGQCIADGWECRPGQITPCSLNSCQFGVKTCDSCGKYGQCVPKQEAQNGSGNASCA